MPWTFLNQSQMNIKIKNLNLREINAKDFIFFALSFLSKKYQKWYNFSGRYKFVTRSKNNPDLLIIIAGYKEYLWEYTLSRIKEYCGPNMDICVVSPGIDNNVLRQICEENSWSYLTTKENKLSLAQNLAIKLHGNAKYIYKLDEDIFIGQDYFQTLKHCYETVKKQGTIDPGFIAPLININIATYVDFLELAGKSNDYQQKFGTINMIERPKIWDDPETAIFAWKECGQLDDLADLAKIKNKDKHKISPIRFSIGAIMFERKIWEEIGGFNVKVGLGYEEEQVNAFAYNHCRPIIISLETLVGHFSYGPQTKKMIEYLDSNKEIFK